MTSTISLANKCKINVKKCSSQRRASDFMELTSNLETHVNIWRDPPQGGTVSYPPAGSLQHQLTIPVPAPAPVPV